MADNFADLAKSKPAAAGGSQPPPPLQYGYWRRPNVPAGDSLNLSDLLENETIPMVITPQKPFTYDGHQLFQPSEITGRSTEFTQFGGRRSGAERFSTPASSSGSAGSPTVEQILTQSFSSEIRSLAPQLEQLRMSHSGGGRFTADMSNSTTNNFDWDAVSAAAQNTTSNPPNSIADDMSFNSSNVSEILKADEREWIDEYATIPYEVAGDSMSKTSTGGATYNIDGIRSSADVSRFGDTNLLPPNGGYVCARNNCFGHLFL